MSCRYSFPAVRVNKRFVTAPAAGALCSTAWNRRKTKCIWYPSVVNFERPARFSRSAHG